MQHNTFWCFAQEGWRVAHIMRYPVHTSFVRGFCSVERKRIFEEGENVKCRSFPELLGADLVFVDPGHDKDMTTGIATAGLPLDLLMSGPRVGVVFTS